MSEILIGDKVIATFKGCRCTGIVYDAKYEPFSKCIFLKIGFRSELFGLEYEWIYEKEVVKKK